MRFAVLIYPKGREMPSFKKIEGVEVEAFYKTSGEPRGIAIVNVEKEDALIKIREYLHDRADVKFLVIAEYEPKEIQGKPFIRAD